MKNDLIGKLSELEMKERHLKRCLDVTYYNNEKRRKFFDELKKIKGEIEQTKFKIRLERKRENDKNSNTKQSNN